MPMSIREKVSKTIGVISALRLALSELPKYPLSYTELSALAYSLDSLAMDIRTTARALEKMADKYMHDDTLSRKANEAHGEDSEDMDGNH
jgi:hypothetical protein